MQTSEKQDETRLTTRNPSCRQQQVQRAWICLGICLLTWLAGILNLFTQMPRIDWEDTQAATEAMGNIGMPFVMGGLGLIPSALWALRQPQAARIVAAITGVIALISFQSSGWLLLMGGGFVWVAVHSFQKNDDIAR